MLVKPAVPPERDEIPQKARPVDPGPAVADLDAGPVRLAGQGAVGLQEIRDERLLGGRSPRPEMVRVREVVPGLHVDRVDALPVQLLDPLVAEILGQPDLHADGRAAGATQVL